MKKNSAIDFYLKVVAWIFLCLVLAGVCQQIRAAIINGDASANESSAAQMISSLNQLQKHYAAEHKGKFAPNFNELIRIGGLDENFAGEKPLFYGYVFEMKVTEPTNHRPAFYAITADPLDSEGFVYTGTRHFYFDSTLGAMRVTDENRQANADDPSF